MSRVCAVEKLKEFHESLPAENRFPGDWLSSLQAIATGSDAFVEANLIKAFEKGLNSWPRENIVPLLDLFQQAIRRIRTVNDHFFFRERGRQLLDQVVGYVKEPSRSSGSPPAPGILICVGRLLANAFAFEEGQRCVSDNGLFLVPILFESGLASDRASAQVATISIITNYTHFVVAKTDSAADARMKLCRLLVDQVTSAVDGAVGAGWCQEVFPALTRAIGTLLWGDEAAISAAKGISGMDEVVDKLKDRIELEDGKHDARCIERMLGRF